MNRRGSSPEAVGRSLFARSLRIIVVLIVAGQLANLLVFRELVQRPRLERLADYVRANVVAVDLALQRLSPAQQADYLDALKHSGSGPLVLSGADVPPRFSAPPGRAPALLLQPLATALGPGYRLHWEHGSRAHLWVGTRLGGTPAWIGFATAGLLPSLQQLLLLGSGISLALALLGAWAIHRSVQRPLQALEAAAQAVGAGKPPQPLPGKTPPEIARVAQSFADMAASLSRAERDRSVLLAGVSHDLRTPLAKLRLCVEMLGPDADAELLASMKRSIATADAIVGQFIDYVRVGSDESPEDLDLTALARRVALDAMLGERLQLDLLPATCPLRGRPVALRRAVMNLLDNAARHADGLVELRLRCSQAGVELAVLDRGPGIPTAERERLLQPFVSGAHSGGSGLGLAVVDRVAKIHGGALDLRDRAGGGLEAVLRLPR